MSCEVTAVSTVSEVSEVTEVSPRKKIAWEITGYVVAFIIEFIQINARPSVKKDSKKSCHMQRSAHACFWRWPDYISVNEAL